MMMIDLDNCELSACLVSISFMFKLEYLHSAIIIIVIISLHSFIVVSQSLSWSQAAEEVVQL